MVSVSNQTAPPSSTSEGEVILSIDGVSKKFCRDLKRSLLYGVQDIATELVGARNPNRQLRAKEFWALKDVSFQLRRGEAVGLVGKNGSGKSTLLRVISGLIRPDRGSVMVKGRLAPLIALGAGFNPVLSGRENIYANMSILGLTSQEIRDRFDEVVAFAEIADAIDAPVHSYSSGMAARLGFACAIHTDPDILLIDEVLAVGDLKFRGKCYRRLAQLRDRGVSFILVSHSSNSILSKCESAVYLSNGELQMVGDAADVTRKYENDLFLEGSSTIVSNLQLPDKSSHESSGLDVNSVFFRDEQGNPVSPPISGKPTKLCIACTLHREIENVNLGLTFRERAGEGDKILVLSTLHDKTPLNLSQGKNEIQVELPYLGLRPSAYFLDAHLYEGNYILLDSVLAFEFVVEGQGSMSQCLFYQPRIWTSTHQA